LLVKRNDVPFWDLPGGTREIGESTIDCLKRETLEETGLEVEAGKKVGNFINYELQDKQIIYTSTIVGGELIKSGPETKTIKFFPIQKLPFNLIPHRKRQIQLAFSNKPAVDEAITNSRWTGLIKRIVS